MKVKELIRKLTEMNMEDEAIILDPITLKKYGINVYENDGEVILETEPNYDEDEDGETGLQMKYKRTIEEVMSEFDFEQTHKMMEAMNWTWYDTHGVPKVSDLKRLARQLLEGVVRNYVNGNYDKEECIIETGGFRAVCTKDDDDRVYGDDVVLKLEFVYSDFSGCSNMWS